MARTFLEKYFGAGQEQFVSAYLTSDQIAEAVGVTYRQLDWWVRKGYLVPSDPSTGSGDPRRWTLNDLVTVAFFVARVRDCPLPHGQRAFA